MLSIVLIPEDIIANVKDSFWSHGAYQPKEWQEKNQEAKHKFWLSAIKETKKVLTLFGFDLFWIRWLKDV